MRVISALERLRQDFEVKTSLGNISQPEINIETPPPFLSTHTHAQHAQIEITYCGLLMMHLYEPTK